MLRKRLFQLVSTAVLALSTVAPAIAAEEVNVYSYRQPFLTEPMFDAFTEATGIKVNTVFAKKGLIERLQNEGSNSPADLVLVTNAGNLALGKETGVSQAVESEVLTEAIPDNYRDPENFWFGLTRRGRIIVTSADRVEEGAIKSYADLAKPEWKGRICTRSGKHDYMVELIASVIAAEGEEAARTWLEGVRDNLARKPQGNDRAQVKAVAEGECDVAVINTYYMGVMLSDPEQAPAAETVNIVFPNQDDRGTHMNISGMFMTKAAPNRENALKLMEFLASDEAQSMYASVNHEYPVNPGVPASELVASWGEFKADTLPLSEVAANRKRASKLVDEVGYDD
ncbi:MAG: iron ABC transporter substrate-binding protein [Gammaproteobacteria bacterium]|nr:MAG: iron ABC transporter substrate-binding protein [Gammaproteobacteria bacterium]